VQFSGNSYKLNESDGNVELTLLRVGGDYGEISVTYMLVSDSATESDYYRSKEERVIFADGETVKTIVIGIVDDGLEKVDESFTVQLFAAGIEIDVATVSVKGDVIDVVTEAGTQTDTETESAGAGSVQLYLLLWLSLLCLLRKERRQIANWCNYK
jgi:hypothetical protein